MPRNKGAGQGRWLGHGEVGQSTLRPGIAYRRKKKITAAAGGNRPTTAILLGNVRKG